MALVKIAYITTRRSAAYGLPTIGPRSNSQNSTAYSVKCALLRTRACITLMVSVDTSGNNQRSIGSMNLDVFRAEKVEVDIVKMSIPHYDHGRPVSQTGIARSIRGCDKIVRHRALQRGIDSRRFNRKSKRNAMRLPSAAYDMIRF